MSYSTALGIAPDRRPLRLAEFRNSHGWSPSIWSRLAKALYGFDGYLMGYKGGRYLDRLWQGIEEMPEWQQAANVLTFDTGIIPWQAFEWAADCLDEFEARLPAPEGHVNHVPAMAALLRSKPQAPWFGVWGTSVTDNPFELWDSSDEEADEPRGIPFFDVDGTPLIYALERHRHLLPRAAAPV